jgi:hypothetical protein
MKNKLFSSILLVLLTVNSNAFPNKPYMQQNNAAFDEVLALTIQTLKEVFPDLGNIKERHYADVIGEIKGVLITLKDAAEYHDNVLKETVFREALTALNMSLERAFSLVLRMAEEAINAQSKADRNKNIQRARALEKLYKQLAALKRELHLVFNETETASRFEREAAMNIEQINQEIIVAENAPLPFINDKARQGILQVIGAVVLGVVAFIAGSISSD